MLLLSCRDCVGPIFPVSLLSHGQKIFASGDKWKTVRVVVVSTHGAFKLLVHELCGRVFIM